MYEQCNVCFDFCKTSKQYCEQYNKIICDNCEYISECNMCKDTKICGFCELLCVKCKSFIVFKNKLPYEIIYMIVKFTIKNCINNND